MSQHGNNNSLNQKISRLRLLSQSLFAIFCIYVGWQFYSFYLWALDPSGNSFVPRPSAVEAFLPLGALVSLKRFLMGAEFDTIHPAGLTIFIAAILISLFFRKGFCGWICPIGFSSNLAERVGKKTGIMFALPAWIDLPLLSVKYLLLGFFAYLILWRMGLSELTDFHRSPYNLISDAKMLHFFLQPSVLAASIMLGIILFSFIIRNFWCRYLCPYGALLGLTALLSPLQIRRDPETCTSCKKCERACPASIHITRRKTVRNCECIGCLECVQACPEDECLTLATPCKKTVTPLLLPALTLGLFFLCYLVARLSGHWNSEIPVEVFQRYYQMIDKIGHP